MRCAPRHRRVAPGLVLVLSLVFAPGTSEAKKVTETAPGVALPDATQPVGSPTAFSEVTQTFRLRGSKVKKKQILDVNLILNATGPEQFSLGGITMYLIGPKGNQAVLPRPSLARIWVDLKIDDQSNQISCNPMQIVDSSCNYWQGETATGSVHASINPAFKGANPKGKWRLLFQDAFSDGEPPIAIGTTTLEVKTGRKFEKESG